MATGPRYKVAFRRRREGTTDYYVRKKLLAGRETRAVVRRSSKYVSVQMTDFTMNGDTVASAASSRELKGRGWEHSCSSIPAAYLTGYLAGKRALRAGIEYAVLDIGMQRPAKGAVLFAVVAGMTDAGLEVPHGEDVLPSKERLNGKHIDDKIEAEMDSIKKRLEDD
jgi:large subunit ribosomal protein L18